MKRNTATISMGLVAVIIVVALLLFSRPDESSRQQAQSTQTPADTTISNTNTTTNNTDTTASTTNTTTNNTDTTASTTNTTIPTWQTLPIVNARTGETFTFADFAGKTVFVEPMATWCSNCRSQLRNVSNARAQLNNENVIFVALSVEAGLANDTLSDYAQDNGFDWHFAVVTPELLTELVAIFGRTVTNPPSTPHFIIRPDGTTTALKTGIESADDIVAQIRTEGGL
ncbi:MAG: redoxin domain-containing protein [Anaerolineae bacterium]|jgi:thiol-disulfide isomerase/thioredoxin|nr:redoxin domain-containing protein [Anaerolineae bacterium]